MRDKIIHKAADMFITLGFKSVTMDDIAATMGISKKTIYANFKNKPALVKEATLAMFHVISHGIDCISNQDKNPIEELYDIKKFVMMHLKDEKSSPQYQLQKYYPEISNTLKELQFDTMQECTLKNLRKGVNQGLYRANLNIEFASSLTIRSLRHLKAIAFTSSAFSREKVIVSLISIYA